MSQRSVETVLGRLATDETLRRRFQADRAAVLDELVAQGVELTPVERRALLELDCGACEPACPVTAIFPEDNVPEQWQNYIAMNYEHFGQSK